MTTTPQDAGTSYGPKVNKTSGFIPTVNINMAPSAKAAPAGAVPFAQRSGGTSLETVLPEPDFSSPAAVRDYASHVQAVAFSFAVELAMAAEILEATLRAVPDPNSQIGGSRRRAKNVSRSLRKAADAASGVAKNAAAMHQKFIQEFQQEIEAVRHRATTRPRRQIDWAQQ